MKRKRNLKCALAAIMISAMAVSGAYGLALTRAEETGAEDMPRNTINEFLLSTWKGYYDFDIASYDFQTKELAEAGMNFIWHPAIPPR